VILQLVGVVQVDGQLVAIAHPGTGIGAIPDDRIQPQRIAPLVAELAVGTPGRGELARRIVLAIYRVDGVRIGLERIAGLEAVVRREAHAEAREDHGLAVQVVEEVGRQVARQLGVDRRFGVGLRIVRGEARLQCLAAHEAQHDAPGVEVGAATLADLAVALGLLLRGHHHRERSGELRRAVHAHLAGPVEHVLVAVDLLRHAGDAHEHVVGHREVVAGLQIQAVRRAVGGLDAAGVVALRLLRDQADRAAEAVLAEQRALRPAQHLDAFEIEQVDGRAGERAVVDVVDVDADAGIRGVDVVGGHHAAHADHRRRAAEAALRLDVGVRDHEAEVFDVVQALFLEPLAGHRGDGQRRVLQVLHAIGGGDDDFFEFCLDGGCRRAGRARQGCGNSRGNRCTYEYRTHDYSFSI
jgi:hypothetical protein